MKEIKIILILYLYWFFFDCYKMYIYEKWNKNIDLNGIELN